MAGNYEKDIPVSIRVNSLVYSAAQDRACFAGVKLPDVIRAAFESVASGDAAAFNCVLFKVVAGNDQLAHTAWLSRRVRDLFVDRDGVLIGKSDRGSRKAGDPVGLAVRGGLPCVSVDAKYVPVRDVVYALHHECWRGDVVNDDENIDNNRYENLTLSDSANEKSLVLNVNLSITELKAVMAGRQKAVVISCNKDETDKLTVITELITRESSIPALLTDGKKQTVRQAIHAASIGDSRFLISVV
ncbi:hypothetical protein CBJ86_000220 [Salmonella enterica subsp. enterica serovar Gateshead]|nr:hypothetical protein [Salmonella enterica subsp. enterica serovar Gateshead]